MVQGWWCHEGGPDQGNRGRRQRELSEEALEQGGDRGEEVGGRGTIMGGDPGEGGDSVCSRDT